MEQIGTSILDIMTETKIIPSKSECRSLSWKGGLSLNGEKVTDIKRELLESDLENGVSLLKRERKTTIK
ncbi:hypothetical protein H7E68_02255 [Clostridium gasigenes]|uniref:Tyrosine--tRNA ligase SYY-like C-terminal domain-containing protein n=1 Tax=Clostridium gasigenes TaxID=94869 RepID=A0A7X0SC90_9CLOT|nr:hypothetical protein [Clostridium gasigenes]